MSDFVSLSGVDFGEPEAEHDTAAIARSFYEAESWEVLSSGRGLPFVVGRKGSGKSAIAARLEYLSRKSGECCFVRIVPSQFRHVEVRDLLACLVNKNASWQYIYRKVWEGIIIGQLVRHTADCQHAHSGKRLSDRLCEEVDRFRRECGFYVAALGDTLSDVITKCVRGVGKRTDALSQVELRKMLQPYSWTTLVEALQGEFSKQNSMSPGMFVAIDGLDEHWDSSAASLYFLAELLAVTKEFTAKFAPHIRFIVCLRDSIFRALVDTKSIEYDKIESLVVNLEWNSRSLTELIARRVAPEERIETAVRHLRSILPESVEGDSTEEYLARHILQRPRDYVNFYRMLQKECRPAVRAGEGHILDAVGKYCANRLMDLENEFGYTYPGISKCITALHALPDTFRKELLLERLHELCHLPSFRAEAPGLMESYGQPVTLARILISIGVIGTYDSESHALRFVHEFSESRVSALWEAATIIGIHPVYCHRRKKATAPVLAAVRSEETPPAVVTHPQDYLAEKESLAADLEPFTVKRDRKRSDLLAALGAIDKGQPHFRRFETWVNDTLAFCFLGALLNAEEQVAISGGSKRFEVIFDIVGKAPPWEEIRGKYRTHRLLVECKNTDEPTDADFNKLVRDMNSLDVDVAFLAYRGSQREPQGRVLDYLRASYKNSDRRKVIIALSEAFLAQCLQKKSPEKCQNNLNSLWRDHIQRWLPS